MQSRSTALVDVILALIGYIVGMSIVLLLNSATAHGQTVGWVEERSFFKEGQTIQRVDGLVNGTINERIGTFVWFQIDPGYAQAYGGLTWSPKPWVQFAGGPGLEQAKKSARVGGYVWLGKGKTAFLFVPEYGGSGFWAKAEFNQSVGKRFGIGAISERYKGTGPKAEVNISKLKFWGAPLWQDGKINGLVGVRYKF
ncbi:MAG: hypothetical protein A2751_02550 [Candidatus Doudnabacteria bacterium RIFCSPHIGHO2_01_FULL_46_14]|uniref:Outer membrane protein beta-barrel domain-containing protein n=1 Tax=Candidatus Doudnabacteria bacterium RIFCSPHIGHO2_01_FULL_46_14 TaxID=1817824 RepID=A0A1F5NJL5_9BACT|nr:MAG: hypothetical protein A2751_02550 [Candidatus Doudnabacteria bacterium RIFCSPHIGHO2_01_FULL_46_14]